MATGTTPDNLEYRCPRAPPFPFSDILLYSVSARLYSPNSYIVLYVLARTFFLIAYTVKKKKSENTKMLVPIDVHWIFVCHLLVFILRLAEHL
jgi:hypothetical protein